MYLFQRNKHFSLRSCLISFLLNQLLVLGVTAWKNVYYDMANITTTATFNAESNTYDISPTTPFNITCFYVNADFTFDYAEVKWSSGSPTSPLFIFNNGQTEPGFQASPWQIPENSPENGSVSLIVDQLPSSYYSNSDSPKIWFKCEVLTVNRDNNKTLIHSYINRSIEISFVSPVEITEVFEDQTVEEGDTLILSCPTSGLPRPTVEWSRTDDRALAASLGGGLIHRSPDGNLALKNITSTDSATYQCSAWNRVTSPVSRTVTVTVLHKPVVTVHTLIVNQMVGYHTELRCVAPPSLPVLLTVRWYYTPLKHSEADEVEEINDDTARYSYTNRTDAAASIITTLVIEPVQEVDFTRSFCCVYENQLGESEACISVQDSDKPVSVNGKKPRKEQINHSSCLQAHWTYFMTSCILATLYIIL